jgi:hypothetical protein
MIGDFIVRLRRADPVELVLENRRIPQGGGREKLVTARASHGCEVGEGPAAIPTATAA